MQVEPIAETRHTLPPGGRQELRQLVDAVMLRAPGQAVPLHRQACVEGNVAVQRADRHDRRLRPGRRRRERDGPPNRRTGQRDENEESFHHCLRSHRGIDVCDPADDEARRRRHTLLRCCQAKHREATLPSARGPGSADALGAMRRVRAVVWLTSQSLGLLVTGCLAIALLAAVGSRFAVRSLVPQSDRERVHAVASPLMSPLGAAFAILAALTLASEAGYLTSANEIVSNEAADSARLAWAATMPEIRSVPIQARLATYLRVTRAHEWRGASAAEGEDPPTLPALAHLKHAVRAHAAAPARGPHDSSESLPAPPSLTNDRRARLAAASRDLPTFYVITLAVSGLALIAGAAALTIRARGRVALLIGGLTIVVGL